MKTTILLVFAVALLCGANALPTIAPAGIDCGNGLFCASGQTCFSNMTGAGELMACSPFSNAVFCHDSRFSCPASSTCSSDTAFLQNTCVASDGSVVSHAAMNVDAMAVAEFRDYGHGLVEVKNAICSPFSKIPSICNCQPSLNGANLGAIVRCPTINVPGGASFGASAHFLPCGSATSFGFSAWTNQRTLFDRSWPGAFKGNVPLDSIRLGVVSFDFRAEFDVAISNRRITANIGLGACYDPGRFGPGSACCNQQCPALKTASIKLPFALFTGVYNFANLC